MLRMVWRVGMLVASALPGVAFAQVAGTYTVSIFPTAPSSLSTAPCGTTEKAYGIQHSIPLDFAPMLSAGGTGAAPFRMVITSYNQPYQINQTGVGSAYSAGASSVFSYAQFCQFTPTQATPVASGTQVVGSFFCSETEQVNPTSTRMVATWAPPSPSGQFTQLFTPQNHGLFKSTLWMSSGTCQVKYLATGVPG
jgi:hypothetical protein